MKTIPQISIDSQVIYDHIKKAEINEVVTYETLSNLIQQNIQGNARCRLSTAINKALSVDGLVFATVRSIGIKRLSDDENSMTTGLSTIKKIRRISNKSLKKLAAVKDFESMSNDAKVRHNMSVCVIGAFRQASQTSKTIKIENALRLDNQKLAINKTLDFFK